MELQYNRGIGARVAGAVIQQDGASLPPATVAHVNRRGRRRAPAMLAAGAAPGKRAPAWLAPLPPFLLVASILGPGFDSPCTSTRRQRGVCDDFVNLQDGFAGLVFEDAHRGLTRPEPVANRNRGGFWQGWLGDWVGRSVGRSHWTIYMYPVGTSVQRLPFHRRQSKLELQRLAAASKHLTAAAPDAAPKSELRQPAGTTQLLLLHLHHDACQRMEGNEGRIPIAVVAPYNHYTDASKATIWLLHLDAINIMNNPPKFKASNGGRINPPKAHKTTMVKNQAKPVAISFLAALLPGGSPPWLAISSPVGHLPIRWPPSWRPPALPATSLQGGLLLVNHLHIRRPGPSPRPAIVEELQYNADTHNTRHDRYLSLILANDAIIIIPSGYKYPEIDRIG
uniref:Uncharacterized protein n=1 Tax=Oryza nivara TaxID=4536 RepID=A0A0E0G222_ORYNI